MKMYIYSTKISGHEDTISREKGHNGNHFSYWHMKKYICKKGCTPNQTNDSDQNLFEATTQNLGTKRMLFYLPQPNQSLS
jgi:hypothetical protein